MNEPEEIFQINVLQVDRDRLASVLRPCHRISLCRLRLLFGSQIDRWSDGRSLVALRLSRMHTDREQFRSRFIRELRRCVLRASRRIVIRSYRFLLSLRLIRRFHEDVIVGRRRFLARGRCVRFHGSRRTRGHGRLLSSSLRFGVGVQRQHEFPGRSGRQFVGASLLEINYDARAGTRLPSHANAHLLHPVRTNGNGFLSSPHYGLGQIHHHASGRLERAHLGR